MKLRIRLAVATILAYSLLAVGFQSPSVQEITILHFNDLHARLTADGGRGGFAHLVTLLKEERAASRNSITLFGGDLVQGTPVSTLFQGTPLRTF